MNFQIFGKTCGALLLVAVGIVLFILALGLATTGSRIAALFLAALAYASIFVAARLLWALLSNWPAAVMLFDRWWIRTFSATLFAVIGFCTLALTTYVGTHFFEAGIPVFAGSLMLTAPLALGLLLLLGTYRLIEKNVQDRRRARLRPVAALKPPPSFSIPMEVKWFLGAVAAWFFFSPLNPFFIMEWFGLSFRDWLHVPVTLKEHFIAEPVMVTGIIAGTFGLWKIRSQRVNRMVLLGGILGFVIYEFTIYRYLLNPEYQYQIKNVEFDLQHHPFGFIMHDFLYGIKSLMLGGAAAALICWWARSTARKQDLEGRAHAFLWAAALTFLGASVSLEDISNRFIPPSLPFQFIPTVTLNPLYAMAGAAVFVFAAPAAYRLSRERRWRSTALLFAGGAILSLIAAMPIKNELQIIQVSGALIVGCLWAVIMSWLSRRQLELPLQVRRDPNVYLWIAALFLPLLLCFFFFTTPILGVFGPAILLFIYFTNGVRYLVLVSAILAAAGMIGTLAASFTSIPWQTKAKLWAISIFAAATLIQFNVRF